MTPQKRLWRVYILAAPGTRAIPIAVGTSGIVLNTTSNSYLGNWILLRITSATKDKAVANLKSYTARVPGDENAARTLDAVVNGKVEIKQLKASP
jgi:hypothetical protein